MPTISTFYGIMVQMFFNDHQPAHFHVKYGEHKATISVATLEVMRGRLPQRALAMVLEWAQVHRVELLADWELCRQMRMPRPIQPLE